MKNENEITSIIANGLNEVLLNMVGCEDYNVVICSERIFLDDYAPSVQDYIAKINSNRESQDSYVFDSLPDGYEKPIEMPYQHTIFFILKMGKGQINFAIWNCPITIEIVSEENSFEVARAMMEQFLREKNFIYENGIIQSYFTPEVSSSNQEMYAGFRALLSVSGYVRCPEENVVFVTNIKVGIDDGEVFDYPFLTVSFDHSAQPDPQAFSGNFGATSSINRMTTQSVSITGYLWNTDDQVGEFSSNVMGAMNNMNRVFRLILVSNIEDKNKTKLNVCDDHFILTGAHLSQEWGDLSPWTLTFARTIHGS